MIFRKAWYTDATDAPVDASAMQMRLDEVGISSSQETRNQRLASLEARTRCGTSEGFCPHARNSSKEAHSPGYFSSRSTCPPSKMSSAMKQPQPCDLNHRNSSTACGLCHSIQSHLRRLQYQSVSCLRDTRAGWRTTALLAVCFCRRSMVWRSYLSSRCSRTKTCPSCFELT